MNEYERPSAERRRTEDDPHTIYRFDSADGKYCYIGVTADLNKRISRHRTSRNRPLFRFLQNCTQEQAREFFTEITEVRGRPEAEKWETELIKAAFMDALANIVKPWPLNERTHDMDAEEFRRIIDKVASERDLPREQLERQLLTDGRVQAQQQAKREAEKRVEAEHKAKREAEKRREAERRARAAEKERERLERQVRMAIEENKQQEDKLRTIIEERKRLERQLRTKTVEQGKPERQLREQIEERKRLERQLLEQIDKHKQLERRLSEEIEKQRQFERQLLAETGEPKQQKRRYGNLAAVLFTTLFITTLSLIILFAVPRLQSPPPDPTHTPTPTLTSSPSPSVWPKTYLVVHSGSTVRACANRNCGPLGTLPVGTRIEVSMETDGEPIDDNARWLVFEYAGQTAYLHSSLAGEQARVARAIDGDSIEVNINGKRYGVRYIGIDSPDGGGICYQEAKQANARLVAGRTVALVRDVSDADRYDRLLRYVYVDSTFVNAALVRDGFAENSVWEPDTRFAGRFRALEEAARAANRGCHPSGVFDDGDPER